MGLKKPVKTGSDLPSLDELIGVDAYPVETDGYIVLGTVPGRACTMESNTPISIKAELGKFGDATAADVASGKTMTSADGLKVAGSLPEVASGSTETLTFAGPSFASGNVRMTGTVGTDKIMRAGSKVMTSIGGNYFGNATAADVVSGKTFTSAAGLKKIGSLVVPEVNDWDPKEMEEEVMLDLSNYTHVKFMNTEDHVGLNAGKTYIITVSRTPNSPVNSGPYILNGPTFAIPEGHFEAYKIIMPSDSTFYNRDSYHVSIWVKK